MRLLILPIDTTCDEITIKAVLFLGPTKCPVRLVELPGNRRIARNSTACLAAKADGEKLTPMIFFRSVKRETKSFAFGATGNGNGFLQVWSL